MPSGVFEPNENNPLEVAKRELLEETGYASNCWTYLGPTIENSAKLTNRIHIYLAEDCYLAAPQHLDETEDIQVVTMSLQQALDMVMDNRICCNCTAQGILKVARILGL